MKNLIFTVIMMCLLPISVAAQDKETALNEKQGIIFRDMSFSEALKAAEKENKLLFMDCFTTWCGPCRKLSNVTFKDSLLADYFNEHFINLKMDMEKGEGIELKKKYEVRGYPTLLFLDSKGEVVYRLLGASEAPELLKNVRFGVESGGLSGLRKRYEGGEQDSTFVQEYIQSLSAANLNKEAEQVAIDFLKGKEEQMLENEGYFSIFYRNIHDVKSAPFLYVATHRQAFSEKFPRYAPMLEKRLLEDWIDGSYAYLKTEPNSNNCTLDEQGLDAYVAHMKQMNVAEAKWVGESLRLAKDGITNQWSSFTKRAEKLLASKTMLGDERHLLEWVTLMNKSCGDMELRQKAVQWCEKVCGDLIKKDEEIKKNLPPGAIPAISMVDYKSRLAQMAGKLKSPME